jgi:hypothetical protein
MNLVIISVRDNLEVTELCKCSEIVGCVSQISAN